MTLEEQKAALVAAGCNQNEQMVVLIAKLIVEGTHCGSEIVRQIEELDYDKSAVGIQLSTNAGANPERRPWFKDSEGLYQLHP